MCSKKIGCVVVTVMSVMSSLGTAQELTNPPENMTVFLNDTAVFECTAVGDMYWWEINGTHLENLVPALKDKMQSEAILENGRYNMKLAILADTLKYNGTKVQCLTRLLSGPWRSSPVAMLWILGTPPPVSDISATSNSSSVTVNWKPPLTGVDPDIWYSVIIYNVTDDENNPEVINCYDCINITDTYYTFSPNSSGICQSFNFSVVPSNGAGKGESSQFIMGYTLDASLVHTPHIRALNKDMCRVTFSVGSVGKGCEAHITSVDGKHTNCHCNGSEIVCILPSDEKYTFLLNVSNDNGGELIIPINFTTYDVWDVPVTEEDKVTVTNSSAIPSLTPPQENKEAHHFQTDFVFGFVVVALLLILIILMIIVSVWNRKRLNAIFQSWCSGQVPQTHSTCKENEVELGFMPDTPASTGPLLGDHSTRKSSDVQNTRSLNSDKGRRKLIDELGNLPAGVSTLVAETGSSGNTLELPTANPPTKSMESEQVIKSDDKEQDSGSGQTSAAVSGEFELSSVEEKGNGYGEAVMESNEALKKPDDPTRGVTIINKLSTEQSAGPLNFTGLTADEDTSSTSDDNIPTTQREVQQVACLESEEVKKDAGQYLVFNENPTALPDNSCYVGINRSTPSARNNGHATIPLCETMPVEKEAGKMEIVEGGPCDNPHGEEGSFPGTECFILAEECTESTGKSAEKSQPLFEGMLKLTVPGNPTKHPPSLPPEQPGVKKDPPEREPLTFENADTVTDIETVQTNPDRPNSSTIAQGDITKEELIQSFFFACIWGYYNILEQHDPTLHLPMPSLPPEQPGVNGPLDRLNSPTIVTPGETTKKNWAMGTYLEQK